MTELETIETIETTATTDLAMIGTREGMEIDTDMMVGVHPAMTSLRHAQWTDQRIQDQRWTRG